MHESMSFPTPAQAKETPLHSVEDLQSDSELDPTEKQDIDIALAALEAAPFDNENIEAGAARIEAEGIILSYGPRAKTYLEAKLKEDKISAGDYSYFEGSWWDEAYDDPFGMDYAEDPDDFSGMGFGSFEQDLILQGRKAQEETVDLLQDLDSLDKGPEPFEDSRKEMPKNYLFFRWTESRKELFQYCKAIAEYLRNEHVPNLIIMDRSSRPLYVGVREYWKSKYPDEKTPNFYFMNPKGFKAREDLTPEEVAEIISDCEWKGDAFEVSSQVRSKKQILDEIEETYTQLVKEKDKPVLIFDTCLHSGRTLEPVCKALREKGFEDLRVGSVNPADIDSRVKTDFFITRRHPDMGCYPFDRDRLVEKTFDHVYSKRTNDRLKRRTARMLRDEIRRIMREQMDNE